MSSSRPDPGPAPEVGLVVRPDRTGFHARIWPKPPLPWARWAKVAPFGLVGAAGLGGLVGDGAGSRVAVALALIVALVLVAAVSEGQGFFPVELSVDDTTVYWNGDRFPMREIQGAEARDGTLVLLGAVGVCATLHHLQPDVARWLAAAIVASLPEPALDT